MYNVQFSPHPSSPEGKLKIKNSKCKIKAPTGSPLGEGRERDHELLELHELTIFRDDEMSL